MFRNQRQIRILLRHGDGIVCITAAFTGDHPNGMTRGQVVVRKDKVRFCILFGHRCTSGKHHHIIIGAVGGEGAAVCDLESALILGAGAAIHAEYRNAARTGDIHRAISALTVSVPLTVIMESALPEDPMLMRSMAFSTAPCATVRLISPLMLWTVSGAEPVICTVGR